MTYLWLRKLGEIDQPMKSPIKDKPLRNPGESLDGQIQDIVFDKAGPYIFTGVFVWTFALVEWVRWFFESPPAPVFYTIGALLVSAFAAFKVRQARKKLHSLKQGRDGEKTVGQYLERLRETGAQVLHDLPGDDFNLDHVVIAASGVYVIETKTYSKPNKGEAKILFKGNALSINGQQDTDKPLIQVRAASNWLRNIIEETTGRKVGIRPVVVFPGWYVEPTFEAKGSDVWVLNPKALPAFIKNSQEQLSNEEVRMISYHLSRFVRSKS
jgi:hypothetical protein